MKLSAVAVAICVGLAAPASALNGGYMNSISGGANAKPSVKPAYRPQTGASPPVANGSYLQNVAAPPKAYANGTPAPAQNAAPTAASYLQQMGGGSSIGSSSGPKKSYSPFKSNVVPKSGGAGFGSYLDKVAGSAPASYSAPPAANSAPTAASYLQQMGGGSSIGSSSGPKKSYSPFKSNVVPKSGGAGFGSYLDKVAGSAPSSYSAPPAANSAPTAASYLQQMGGGSSIGSSSGPKKSYSPFKSNVVPKSGGAGFGSYLDRVGGSAPASISSGYGAPPGPEEPSFTIPAAPKASSYLGGMGGSSAPKKNYAPTQSSWKR
jgi:hypothetical protein